MKLGILALKYPFLLNAFPQKGLLLYPAALFSNSKITPKNTTDRKRGFFGKPSPGALAFNVTSTNKNWAQRSFYTSCRFWENPVELCFNTKRNRLAKKRSGKSKDRKRVAKLEIN